MKTPLDLTPYPRDPSSKPITAATEDGSYVFVRDGAGTVFVVPDGPHMHPKVLGGASPAMYAGDLTVRGGRVIDLTIWSQDDYLMIEKRDSDLAKKLHSGVVVWGSNW